MKIRAVIGRIVRGAEGEPLISHQWLADADPLSLRWTCDRAEALTLDHHTRLPLFDADGRDTGRFETPAEKLARALGRGVFVCVARMPEHVTHETHGSDGTPDAVFSRPRRRAELDRRDLAALEAKEIYA